jgi:hypothetical protein
MEDDLRYLALLIWAAALTLLASIPAGAEPVRHCELKVDGTSYIDGPCDFEAIGGGDFVIRGGDFFAYVYVAAPATGFWNGTDKGNHAHTPLGELKSSGACWSNATARVCAQR